MASVQLDTDRFDEVHAVVGAGLAAYNDQFLPKPRDRTPFAASIRNDEGKIIGGIVGASQIDWLYIDLLWIDDSERGNGHGAALMDIAEKEARARGLSHITLWTWSFQAPAFYKAQGFTEYGRLTDHPKGHDSIQFVKRLL